MKTEKKLNRKRFTDILAVMMSLVNSLGKEYFIIKSHPDVSPPDWHLAHTIWFWNGSSLRNLIEIKNSILNFITCLIPITKQ
ncbi:hypothetical protein V1502_09445 [Bacillus sp. SCS-153A]|uniref:hypothetical protein n=1 Tax=Rossellomorea sedimentorum TaxID=3115294 RepID=UPI0039067DFD